MTVARCTGRLTPPQPIGEPAVEAERTLCWDNPARRGLRWQRHGGHTRSTTRPTMESTGTGPNDRESTEPKRWSPRRETVPAGGPIRPKEGPPAPGPAVV